jgi:uncharacterized OB-fold protein
MNEPAAKCRKCGATLSPNLDWCSQCLTPIHEHAPGEHEGEIDDATSIEELPRPELSSWRGGPYSFGPLGRIVITILVMLGGGVMYLTARVVGDFYGHPGLGLVLILEAVYLVFAIAVLWGVWRPERVNK